MFGSDLNILSKLFYARFILDFNSWALIATMTVLKLINAAPIAGPITNPTLYKTPAANGIAITL